VVAAAAAAAFSRAEGSGRLPIGPARVSRPAAAVQNV
jgi:hypothetical protein